MPERLRNVRLVLGSAMLVVTIGVAISADTIAPYNAYDLNVGAQLAAPSAEHPIGTDNYGRDQLSRLFVGTRISLQAALVVGVGALLIGMPLGLIAGYIGGPLDDLIGRLQELIFAVPWLLVALVLAAIFKASLSTALASLVIVYAPVIARVTRAAVLGEASLEYVAAAQVIGGSAMHIILRHIVPNVVSPVLILVTSIMAYAVLAEASLSYLGLAAQPPLASWGRMLTESSLYFGIAPHLAIYPGLAISYLVLALNLLGDGLRDYLDPRLVQYSR